MTDNDDTLRLARQCSPAMLKMLAGQGEPDRYSDFARTEQRLIDLGLWLDGKPSARGEDVLRALRSTKAEG